MPILKLKTKPIISDVTTTQKGVWNATSEAVLGVTDPEIEENRESNSQKTLNFTSIIIFVCFGLLLALIIIGVVSVLIVQKRQYKRKLELAEEMRKEEEEERKRKKKKRRRHKKRKKRRKEREKLSKKQEDAKQCFDVKTALVDYLENQTYSRITPLDEQQSAKREGSGLLEDQPNKNDEQIVQTPKDDLSPKNEGPELGEENKDGLPNLNKTQGNEGGTDEVLRKSNEFNLQLQNVKNDNDSDRDKKKSAYEL